jgi:subtilisin family serine protease
MSLIHRLTPAYPCTSIPNSYLEHAEFDRRARAGASYVPGETAEDDLNGHGTHCAGTVGSKNFGIAKEV